MADTNNTGKSGGIGCLGTILVCVCLLSVCGSCLGTDSGSGKSKYETDLEN